MPLASSTCTLLALSLLVRRKQLLYPGRRPRRRLQRLTGHCSIRYCVGCHNERTLTGGLALDVTDVTDVSQVLEIWEKAVLVG